jgi:kynurenine 3-monooxygenase
VPFPAHGRAVVGAGLAGSMMALMLAKRGYHVDLYEKRPDFRLSEGPVAAS